MAARGQVSASKRVPNFQADCICGMSLEVRRLNQAFAPVIQDHPSKTAADATKPVTAADATKSSGPRIFLGATRRTAPAHPLGSSVHRTRMR